VNCIQLNGEAKVLKKAKMGNSEWKGSRAQSIRAARDAEESPLPRLQTVLIISELSLQGSRSICVGTSAKHGKVCAPQGAN